MSVILVAASLIVMLATEAFGATTWYVIPGGKSSDPLVTRSCEFADVFGVVFDAAVIAGDTVVIGPGMCTWSSQPTMGYPESKAITLMGSGTGGEVCGADVDGQTIAGTCGAPTLAQGGTVINYTVPALGWDLHQSTVGNVEIKRITMNVDATVVGHGVIGYSMFYVAGGKVFIFHHNTINLTNFPVGDCGGRIHLNWDAPSGVIYRNIFSHSLPTDPGCGSPATNAVTVLHHDTYNAGLGATLWASTSTLGTLDAPNYTGNIYFETNIVRYSINAIDQDNGSRGVFRNNIMVGAAFTSHGQDSSLVGVRQWEIYKNVFIDAGTSVSGRWIGERGGTGVVYENVAPATNDVMSMNTFVLGNKLIDTGPPPGVDTCYSFTGEAGCPGTYCAGDYPWIHQIAQGYNGSHTLDANGNDQQLDPVYVWNNYTLASHGGTLRSAVTVADTEVCNTVPPRPTQAHFLQSGRDYFNNAGAKPSYTAAPYPHPLATELGTPPVVNVRGGLGVPFRR